MTDDIYEEEEFDGFEGPGSDVEAGLHAATLTKLTRKTLTGPYGTSPAIIWTFGLEGGGELDGTTSEATGLKSKARPWLEALVGRERVKELVQRKIEPKELVGRECQVLVGFNDAGYPRVESVLPAPKAAGAPGTARPATTEPERGTVPVELGEDLADLPF